jgi:SAM-dependent methyltransferase
LADWFERIDATDASAAQIQRAIPHSRIRYAVGSAEESGLPDRSVDLVSVGQALHWFDLPRFFDEVRRVARPRGLLAVYGYAWFYVSPAIDNVVNEYLLEPLAAYSAPQLKLLWDGYRTVDFPFEEILPPRMAIHVRWSLDQLLGYCATWSSMREHLKTTGEEFLQEARERLSEAWGDESHTRNIVIPLSIRLAMLD